MRRRLLSLTAGGALLASPVVAQAHVSFSPNVVPAGATAALTLRVPDESDRASTTSVAIQLPPGFISAAVQPPPGWRVGLVHERLAHPVKTDDGTVTEQVREIRITGDGAQGRIAPGQFAEFPLFVQMPDPGGRMLTFPVVQTYSDGHVDRWIGSADSDSPAPTVAEPSGGPILDLAGSETGPPPSAVHGVSLGGPSAAATPTSSTSNGTNAVQIVAAVLAGVGLLAALAALGLLRRPPAPRRRLRSNKIVKEAW